MYVGLDVGLEDRATAAGQNAIFQGPWRTPARSSRTESSPPHASPRMPGRASLDSLRGRRKRRSSRFNSACTLRASASTRRSASAQKFPDPGGADGNNCAGRGRFYACLDVHRPPGSARSVLILFPPHKMPMLQQKPIWNDKAFSKDVREPDVCQGRG